MHKSSQGLCDPFLPKIDLHQENKSIILESFGTYCRCPSSDISSSNNCLKKINSVTKDQPNYSVGLIKIIIANKKVVRCSNKNTGYINKESISSLNMSHIILEILVLHS